MKIRIEIAPDEPEEIIIRTKELSDTVCRIQEAVKSITSEEVRLVLKKDDVQYFPDTDSILFFETTQSGVCAHTANEVFDCDYKLYELVSILPRSFIRVSKSTIINTNHVYSVNRNLTASSIVEFRNSHKKVYVSRGYYKEFMARLEEKR